MAVNLAPGPFGAGGQFFTSGGVVLNAGLLYQYAAGTTTPQATYTTSAGNVQSANPVILTADGRNANEMWFTAGLAYKLILTDAIGNVIGTWDNLSGINDFSALAINSEWTPTNLTPIFVNTTSFTLPGDQTGIFKTNRRVRLVETAGTVYGVVTSSTVLSSVTTVNVTIDSGGVVDSGLSVVSYGIINSVNTSMPQIITAGTQVTVTYAAGVPTINAAVTAVNGASLVLIQRIAVTAVANIDFLTGFDGTFDQEIYVVTNVVPGTADSSLSMRFSQDAGATFKSGGTDYSNNFNTVSAGANAAASAAASAITVGQNCSGTATDGGWNGEIKTYGITDTTHSKNVGIFMCNFRTAVGMQLYTNYGLFTLNTAAVNGVRFLPSAGSFLAGGSIARYGVRKA